MFSKYLDNVRKASPLVHCITNYVTVNDVANVLLACGANPVMADEPLEVCDITGISNALYINTGTLNQQTVEAMFLAGKCANKLSIPVVLDPVGAGASRFRTETVRKLIHEVKFDVIRGNISEIKAALQSGTTKGVDANALDRVTEENLGETADYVKKLALHLNCVIIATGAIDIVSDGEKCCIVRNGRAEMSRVTGTGCQLSALIAAFAAANPGKVFEASAAAVCLMGLAGELAFGNGDGNSTYRNRIIDFVYNMTGEALEQGAKYEFI